MDSASVAGERGAVGARASLVLVASAVNEQVAVVAGLADSRFDRALALAIRIALCAVQRGAIGARARVASLEVARGALLSAVRERTSLAIEVLRCRDSVRALFQARAAGLAARLSLIHI